MSQAQRDSQGGPAPMDVAEERMIIPNCTLAVEEFPEQYIESQCLARLLHIAEHCPQARLKALKVAEKVSRQCMDVGMQRQIVKLLRAACVDHNEPYPSGMPSEALIDAKSLRVKEKIRSYDDRLKVQQNNLVKQLIGEAYSDLGGVLFDAGELAEARRALLYARNYLPHSDSLSFVLSRLLLVLLADGDFDGILAYAPRHRELLSTQFNESANVTMLCCTGLAYMHRKQYRDAANAFLKLTLNDQFEEVMLLSPSNVATYATLCCLASMSRDDIKDNLILNAEFQSFLEASGLVRTLAQCFHASKFKKCQELITNLKNDLYADLYLFPCVDHLLGQIRIRAFNQYFSPFKNVTLSAMAAAFDTTTEALEDELARVIADDQLSARIDSDRKVLCAVERDPRQHAVDRGIQVMQRFQRTAEALLLNAAVLQNKLHNANPSNSSATAATATHGGASRVARARARDASDGY